MKIGRSNCEAFLMHILKQLLHTGVTTVAALLSNDALKNYLWQSLLLWGNYVACTQHTVASIAREIGMTHQEMVSDFVHHIFSRGTKADKPYPRLTELLRVAGVDSPAAAVRYLMRTARNRALDLERRHEVRTRRSGCLRGFTQDDEYGVLDPGEAPDDASLNLENDIARKSALERFLASMGEDFVSDTVILADALDIRRARVAGYFLAGQQEELVEEINRRLSRCLHRSTSPRLKQLRARARAYRLPARFRREPDALLAHLYRQSSGAARRRLASRLEACGY